MPNKTESHFSFLLSRLFNSWDKLLGNKKTGKTARKVFATDFYGQWKTEKFTQRSSFVFETVID